MTWLADYEKNLEVKLKGRLAHDFPLLERSHIDALYDLLVAEKIVWNNACWRYIEEQLGSADAIGKFLDLYWPSRAADYRAGGGHRTRAGRPRGLRSRPKRRPGA